MSSLKSHCFPFLHASRFPHCDAERLRRWVINVKRDAWTPVARSRLCSEHFKAECFDRTGQTVRLKADAVPTIFTFPNHLKKKPWSHKPPAARSMPDDNENKPPEDVSNESSYHRHLPSDGHPLPDASSVQRDHPYTTIESSKELKRKRDKTTESLEKCNKKLKVQQQESKHLKQKVDSLSGIIHSLQDKHLISDSCTEMLESTFSDVSKELMKQLLNKKNNKGSEAYPEELRFFAMTLQFYSAKAYNYIRQTFDLALPHPELIRAWYAVNDGDPGFTKPTFLALQACVEDDRKNGKETICAVIIDEMSIRKHVEFVNKMFQGYVDIGNGTINDSTPLAKDVLVLMAVSINGSWKIPLGYFFIDTMTGQERANLVSECFYRLHAVGVKAVSLTCDGPSCHFAMMRTLGADMAVENMRPSFPHPADSSQQVHVFLDVCHMLKLIRNSFADGGILKDKDGNTIRWEHIEKLNSLQESEGLGLKNRLRHARIGWRKQKMRINLATHVFSASVADMLEYCSDHLKLPQFQGCTATVTFLRMVDAVFDLLNSRNPLGKGCKAPMRSTNKDRTMKILDEGDHYILGLKDAAGKPMHAGPRKTGFIGLVASMRSVASIFRELVDCESPVMKYLLTYKFSQDQLELLFSAVRCKGGFDNNPTTQQFKAAYKRLFIRHNIKPGTGECIVHDNTQILNVLEEAANVDRNPAGFSSISTARKCDVIGGAPLQDDHEYKGVPNFMEVSLHKQDAINYITGFVVRILKKHLDCWKCTEALTDTHGKGHPFFALKNRGGLEKPSPSLVTVCVETEKCLQLLLKSSGGKLQQGTGIQSTVSSAVLQNTADKKLFANLESHMFDTSVEENHLHILIKLASRCFTEIRLHHLGKGLKESLMGTHVRKQQMSKLICFEH
uniref:THAP-type domain-containing protein n=1 Tax=Eptatretus burgeri TaxID=7764 RepID=A0A8C4N4D4_EPTBU